MRHWFCGLALSVALLAACHAQPAISAGAVEPTPADYQAVVWFIRGPHPLDTASFEDVAIADEAGHFVALLGQRERVGIVVLPGRHVYFAFRDGGADLRAEEAGAIAPPALIVEAAAGAVYGVETNLVGVEKAFAVFAPISPRFGRDEVYLAAALHATEPLDATRVQVFEQTRARQYGWRFEWQRGVAALNGCDAMAIEARTLRISDSF